MNLRLKLLLLSRDLRQRDLAAKTGRGEPRVSNIITGWKTPTPTEKATIAKALEVSIEEVFEEVQHA